MRKEISNVLFLVELSLSCPVLGRMCIFFESRFRCLWYIGAPRDNGSPRLWYVYIYIHLQLTHRLTGGLWENSLFSCCSHGRSSVLGTVPFCDWFRRKRFYPPCKLYVVYWPLVFHLPDPRGFHTRCGRPMRSAPKHMDSEYAIRWLGYALIMKDTRSEVDMNDYLSPFMQTPASITCFTCCCVGRPVNRQRVFEWEAMSALHLLWRQCTQTHTHTDTHTHSYTHTHAYTHTLTHTHTHTHTYTHAHIHTR